MVTALTSNSYAQSVNFLRDQNPRTHENAHPPAASGSGEDKVSISSEGLFAVFSDRLNLNGNENVSIGSIEASFRNAKADVEDKIQALYDKYGISDSSEMKISVGYDGKIIVKGEEPKAGYLAEGINADDELSNSIRGMSAKASLLKAIENHQEFAEAYEKDPIAAVQRYGYLLEDGHHYHVSFSMKDGHMDTNVEYV